MLHLLFGGRNSIGLNALYLFSGLVFVFLIAPILVIIPLSFNQAPYFTFPIEHFSLKWYEILAASPAWQLAARNSVLLATLSTLLATVLGTLASLALAKPDFPLRSFFMALVTAPLVVPVIITAVGLYFAYVPIGLTGSFLGLVLAHATIATPFVVLTVTSILASFDQNLVRAGLSLGASPVETFWRITLPIILPGIVSGMIFAFIVSFDDVVIALFLADAQQWTLPRQMWSGLRENVDPTILAAGTLLAVFSAIIQIVADGLRRRNLRRASRAD